MDSVLRIIDANLNRAREGLRVMEDVARFHLDDAVLCEGLKRVRHELAAAVGEADLGEMSLMGSRDTAGDVGTGVKVEGEMTRATLREAAVAAGKRVGEALRSVEEGVKVRGGPARAFERLRYRVYDLEKALIMAMGAARACPQWRVCVLITESLCRRPWWEVVKLARAGGADCFQLREKGLSDAELLKRAKWLVELATESSGPDAWALAHRAEDVSVPPAHVIINDRPDIAILSGAHGVHLGQGDMAVADARRISGERLWVGVSTHDMGEATAALRAGADYAGVGAMFETGTKPRAASGARYLREYLESAAGRALPHLAIGGITPANVGELVKVGCRGVAVSSVVCGSEQPGAVCRELRGALERGV